MIFGCSTHQQQLHFQNSIRIREEKKGSINLTDNFFNKICLQEELLPKYTE